MEKLTLAALIAAAVALLLCAALTGYLLSLERSLRQGADWVRAQLEGQSTVRLNISAPNPAAEALFAGVNALLERRQEEGAAWLRREQDLRRQIANVSHDLRTPLTSILGYLQLLERGDLPEERRREYLAVIEGRARTLQTFISAFYDLSRIEGGEWPMERERLDLGRLLSDQLAESYEQLEEAGLTVRVELEPDLPAARGDRQAAVRIFSNLLTNALRHGSGELVILLRRDGDRLLSSVSNQAEGLTEEDAGHVFERFYTGGQARDGGGTGLGLAIVKALAERMGCQVGARCGDGRFAVEVRWPIWRS